MARLIALLLVFCTVGTVTADARCSVSCAIIRCNLPATGTNCHHHQRPDSQQCLHHHNVAQAWTRTASWNSNQLQAAGFAALAFPAPVPDRASHAPTLNIASEPPPGPLLLAALRI